MPRFMLEGPRPCYNLSLFCARTLCTDYVTRSFLLVTSLVISITKQLLCFVHGQCQKESEQKYTAKNFVVFITIPLY